MQHMLAIIPSTERIVSGFFEKKKEILSLSRIRIVKEAG